jgi:hypothetical protein
MNRRNRHGIEHGAIRQALALSLNFLKPLHIEAARGASFSKIADAAAHGLILPQQ